VPNDQALQERITKIFADHLNVEVPSHDTDLLDAQLLDSMGIVDLLLHIEDQLGVRIGLEELEIKDFRSVALIAKTVGSRLRSQNTRAA
jgi:D-alanine--poly(phosphoribitol) ligase subunit 2